MCAATVAVRSEDGEMIVDPTKEEESEARATLMAAFLINPKTMDKTVIVATRMRGRMSDSQVFDAVSLCRGAAMSVAEFFNDKVLERKWQEEEFILTPAKIQKLKEEFEKK